MAYDPNGLRKVVDIPNVFTIWLYRSTDALATVNTSGYFADGVVRGLKPGDVVLVDDTDSSPRQISIAVCNDIASAAVDIGNGLDITATDSD